MNKKIVWLPYDFDTAIGINNEGALVFSYNLEDTDHLEGGADVFNGQESVVWVNIRDAFRDELMQMYQTLRSTGALSYAKVEQMFEEHQDKWPEVVFNEDAWFKYIDPLIAPEAGAQPTGAYLSMMQGSKEEQRKWWLYNRFRYIDSKYNAGDSLSDVITVRGYAKANITITPYADIYPSVKYGSYLVQTRGQRGVASEIVCPLDNVNDTEIYIYSASQLAEIGDLSGLLVGFADFSMGTKLQHLKVGDSSQSYANTNLKELYLGNNVLLKTLDVRNCTALGTGDQKTVDISGCVNIEEVYFDNTALSGVTLPNGGVLNTLHLPSTITNLTILNQKALTNLVASYSNISTLRLENNSSAIDSLAILQAVPANTRVRLIGFTWEAQNATEISGIFDLLDTMRGLDESGGNVDTAQVSGTIHTSALTGEQIADFNSRYPYVNVTADHISVTLTYRTYDGSSVIATETVLDGGNGTRTNSTARASTAQYTYTPNGWATTPNGARNDSALLNVTTDRTVYAAYTQTVRTYVVTWKNANGTTLETDTNVPYGATPSYDGVTPTQDGQTSTGWNPTISTVTGNITYTAVYVPTYTVKFYNGTTLLQTVTVPEGSDAVYTGETPTSSTGAFIGWSPNPVNVTSNMDCYAMFDFVIVEPDLKYLVYTIEGNEMIITGLNVQQILADNLSVITIPDTIQGYHVTIG